ncbi:MAG TPA: glycosyltransferase family 2 protein [Thermoanaerobaculia bacterium]|nr:glycosyltransferase family 2 protein [Thermoanaerobaculia bacterium]
MNPDISIIVVTWNSAPWIERCLRAIPAAAGSRSFETIVWDNASSDASAPIARGVDVNALSVVDSATNRGFAGALNDAMPRARGRYIFLLNPDCETQPGSIETLAAFLDETGAAGAVPLLVGDDGEPQSVFQLRRFPTLRSILADVLLVEKIHPANRATRAYRYGGIDLARPQAIEQPAAAALMLRRETIDATGPFDERFHPAWFEDVDYCRRIHDAGGRLYLVPAARVVHAGGSSVDVLGLGRFLELWYRNLYRYAGKWLGKKDAERVRMAIVGGMILRIGAAAAGIGLGAVARRDAIAAYRRVLGQAWRRWDETSRPS